MLPENTGLSLGEYAACPTKTYHINLRDKCIKGKCDGIEAMRQAIYKTLATVRLRHIIYSAGYGTDLMDYMDRLAPYVWCEIERTITNALMRDDRILAVRDFDFAEDKKTKVLKVSFFVETTEGNFDYEWEVNGFV